MKQDKFLMGIIAGIIGLVAIALVIFITRGNVEPQYQPEDTPKGIVTNYILAVQKGEYEKAYASLGDFSGKPTLIQFKQYLLMNAHQQTASINVITEHVDDNSATVAVETTYPGGGLFNEGYPNKEFALLEKVDGKWKVFQMPYSFWSFDWNQTVVK